MGLEQVSEAELAAELQRRTAAREAAMKAARLERNKQIFVHKDLLLSLMEHGRTSCSDENPSNGYAHNGYYRCYKCALILTEEHDLDTVEIVLGFTITPRGDHND